jgi:hypothetical protein
MKTRIDLEVIVITILVLLFLDTAFTIGQFIATVS